MGSAEPSKPGGYPVYFAHDPTHFVEETGGGMNYIYIVFPKNPIFQGAKMYGTS